MKEITEGSSQETLTHHGGDFISKDDIQATSHKILARIERDYSEDLVYQKRLTNLVYDLQEFALGRFLLKNRSLSGYWTHYVISAYQQTEITNPVEQLLVERAPGILATRQRYQIFQEALLRVIAEGDVVCSIPCGMMADLITLDLPETIKEVQFVGIDLDGTVFDLAKQLARETRCRYPCSFFESDAWALSRNEAFNLITSNGLNIYEPDEARVEQLYNVFFQSLKPGGYLIGSALNTPHSWGMARIEQEDLALQKMIFIDILQANWSHFRSPALTTQQLVAAGFKKIKIIPDDANIFYTFIAHKLIKKAIK